MFNEKQKKPFVFMNNEISDASRSPLFVSYDTSIVYLKLALRVIVSSVAQVFTRGPHKTVIIPK